MPYEPFLRPKLNGRRFDGGVIPLDALTELQAYSELVSAVARALFFQRNPDRKRVGKGFKDDSTLVLRGEIGEGSALPAIDRWVPYEQVALPGFSTADAILDARELVGECVLAAAAGVPLPADFDLDLLPGFSKFGRRLRPGESIELRTPNGKCGPIYDQSVRRKILGRVPNTVLEESVEVRGSLHGLDAKSKTFTFTHAGVDIVGTYDPLWSKSVIEAVAAYDVDPSVQSVIKGVAKIEGERLVKITQVYDIALLEKPDPVEMEKMENSLSTLARLSDGWLDGDGVAPSPESLDFLRDALTHLIERERLSCPRLYPTEDGGARAEWFFQRWDISAEFNPVDRVAYLHALELDTDEEEDREISLGSEQAVGDIAAFVRKYQAEGGR